VVLAVVATVKAFEDAREPDRVDGIIQFERRGRPKGKFGSRESTA
jgi:hypothetical protein